MNDKQYETVIGVEVHVELSTKTKIFCACSTVFGDTPNTHTCPVCLGMPGALPVLNKQVVEYAIATGLATGCTITRDGRFDRKNYFYPDNPQNYQISQLYLPICRNGGIEIETPTGKKTVGIHEIHMEEDAGKLLHEEEKGTTLVDYNRAGVPLIEIVSSPDMNGAEEVVDFLEKLRLTLKYLGVSDCKMQEGSMRCDVNLSVRRTGEQKLGTRTEMKNLNSFKAIARAVKHERNRQITQLDRGETIRLETRRWDDLKGESYSLRSKEDARDYRYFPDPDLMPLSIEQAWIDRIRARQPELREKKLQRYCSQYDLLEYDAKILTESKYLADFFEAVTAICHNPKKASNWLMGETMRLLNESGMEPEDIKFSPKNLAGLIALTEQGVINSTVAKQVFEEIFHHDIDPENYVKDHSLNTVEDKEKLRRVIKQIITNHPQSAADYRSGRHKAIGFLVGQTMKAMQSKADPGLVNQILKELLAAQE